jgi:Cu-Zn family superoxide dismutase
MRRSEERPSQTLLEENMNRLLMLVTILSLGLVVGCGDSTTETGTETGTGATTGAGGSGEAQADGKIAVANIQPSKAATTQPANGQPTGTVTFTQSGEQVKVVADITGLTPNTTHGFHIHEKGDLSAPDLSSAGGHYNPEGHAHGGPTTSPVHAGDLGNLKSDAQGHAHLELSVDNISLGGENDIIGLPVIVHAKADDLKSQPSGDAGARIGGGIIELKQ